MQRRSRHSTRQMAFLRTGRADDLTISGDIAHRRACLKYSCIFSPMCRHRTRPEGCPPSKGVLERLFKQRFWSKNKRNKAVQLKHCGRDKQRLNKDFIRACRATIKALWHPNTKKFSMERVSFLSVPIPPCIDKYFARTIENTILFLASLWLI